MRRALPFVAAGVVVLVAGVVAAVLLMDGGDGPAKGGKRKQQEAVTEVVAGDEGEEPKVRERRQSAPGTLRPMNEGETEALARRGRPLNQHVARVSSWWATLGLELRNTDPDLSVQIEELNVYLQDQTRRNEDTLDVAATIDRELALAAKTRAAHGSDPRFAALLDYVEASANAVKNGEDPTKVVKPDVPKKP